jgi:hypothetical protein
VVYAHGYVRPDLPLALPDEIIGGVPVSAAVNALGYAFATTSYRANGLVADVAVGDLVELDETVRARYRPDPSRTYVVGFSRAGWWPRAGARAGGLCRRDRRLRPSAISRSRPLFRRSGWCSTTFSGCSPVARWSRPTAAELETCTSRPSPHLDDEVATGELLSVTGAPVDPANPETVGETVIGLLWYSVFAPPMPRPVSAGSRATTRPGLPGLSDDAASTPASPDSQRSGRRPRSRGLRPPDRSATPSSPCTPAVIQSCRSLTRGVRGEGRAAGAGALLDEDAVGRYGHCTFEQGDFVRVRHAGRPRHA